MSETTCPPCRNSDLEGAKARYDFEIANALRENGWTGNARGNLTQLGSSHIAELVLVSDTDPNDTVTVKELTTLSPENIQLTAKILVRRALRLWPTRRPYA